MIIKIGEVEWHDLQRQFTFARPGRCAHARLQYIDHGELLKCLDCNDQVSAVWALKHFFTQYQREQERLDGVRAGIKKDETRLVIHRAALAVQDAWRKRTLVPTCPHCHQGILPMDGFGRTGGVSREYYKTAPLRLKRVIELTIPLKDESGE
jgi:hypothetical protein